MKTVKVTEYFRAQMNFRIWSPEPRTFSSPFRNVAGCQNPDLIRIYLACPVRIEYLKQQVRLLSDIAEIVEIKFECRAWSYLLEYNCFSSTTTKLTIEWEAIP